MAKRKNSHLPTRILERLAKSEAAKVKGQHEKAASIAQDILKEDPTCVEAAEEYADNLLSLGKMPEATKAAEYAMKLEPESAVAGFVLGFIASHQEDWEVSVSYLMQANQGMPNNSEILRCLGWSMFHAGDTTGGVAALKRALSLKPEDVSILCDLSACLLQLGSISEAMKYLEKAESLDPHADHRVEELSLLARKLQKIPGAQ